jgi:hypothetical protein
MTWTVSDDEYDGVLKAGAAKQYSYLVSRCADWGEVWGLAIAGGDWAMMADGDGVRFAVWPHRRYAEACRQRHWSDREPTPIDVESFVDDLIPRLIEDVVGIAAFPLPDGRFTPVSARRLRSDLEGELDRIGGAV